MPAVCGARGQVSEVVWSAVARLCHTHVPRVVHCVLTDPAHTCRHEAPLDGVGLRFTWL